MNQRQKTKLEKQFYQTFNISKTYMNCDDCPHYYRDNSINNSKPECNFIHSDEFDVDDNYCVKLDFPPITDSIYMELMVVIQRNHLIIEGYPEIQTKEELKEFILMALLQNVDIVRGEIQELFKAEKGIVDNNV